MDVREKLVDIVCDATQINGCIHSCNHPPCAMVSGIVDALIENGVTVQEWISVRDKLPDQSGEVLVIVSGNPQKNITLNCAYELAEYDPYDGWIMEMWPEWEDAVVTHWMPLPLPPKGE